MQWPPFEPRHQDDGAYFVHDGPRTILVDVHHVELRRAGTSETYSRPVVSVDRGTSIRFSADVAGVLAGRDRRWTDSDFRTGVVRLDPNAFRQFRALRRALQQRSRVGVEERAMALVASVAGRARRTAREDDGSPRQATALRHRETVDRVREILTVELQHQPSLAHVAAAV